MSFFRYSVLVLALITARLHALDVSAGPLLVFTHPEISPTEVASVGGNPDGRVEALYFVDPQVSLQAHRVPPALGNLTVIARPSQQTLLVAYHERSALFASDLATGKSRPLLGDRHTNYVASDGPKVFFFEELQERDLGYKLDTSPDDLSDERVVPTAQGRNTLFRVDLSTAAEPVAMTKEVVERLLAVTATDIWVITDGRELWRIAKDGSKQTRVLKLSEGWVTTLIHPKFSPDGKRLALSAVPVNHFFKLRDLLVVDAETGKTLFEQKGLYVGMEPASNSIPGLYFSWLDNERLSFVESIVTKNLGNDKVEGFERDIEIDVATGKRIKETKLYDEIWPSYGLPENQPTRRPETRVKAGLFEREKNKLFYAGDEHAIIDLDVQREMSPTTLEISPDGNWAAYYSQSNQHYIKVHGDSPFLVDGKTKQTHRLISGWVYDMKWLEAWKQ